MRAFIAVQIVVCCLAWIAQCSANITLYRNSTAIAHFEGDAPTLGRHLHDVLRMSKNGDVLVTGPVDIQAEELVVDSRITWHANKTRLITKGDHFYQYVVLVRHAYAIIDGLRVDGQGLPNQAVGRGILVTGNRVTLSNCVTSGIKGQGIYDGRGVEVSGDDVLVKGLVSNDNGYVGIMCSNADDLVIDGCRLLDNGDNWTARSIQFTSTIPTKTFRVSNTYCYAKRKTSKAFINVNAKQQVRHVVLDTVRVINDDQLAEGVSFDLANREQCVKFENVDLVEVRSCDFWYGRNRDPKGSAVAWAFDNPAPKHVKFTGCTTSGSFSGAGDRIETYSLEDCEIGIHGCPHNVLNWNLPSCKLSFLRCKFNVHDGVRAFTMANDKSVPGDFLHIVDCVFEANKDSDVSMLDGNGLLLQPRPVISVGNTYNNLGKGKFLPSKNRNLYLILNSDRNGDMLLDPKDRNMPFPGLNPPYFKDIPRTTLGQKIVNLRWNGSGMRYWINTGDEWRFAR